MTEIEEEKKSGGLSIGATLAIVLFFIAIITLYVLYNTSNKGTYHSNNYFVADLFSNMLMTIITAPFELIGAMAGGG